MRHRNRSYERTAVGDRQPSKAKLRHMEAFAVKVWALTDNELERKLHNPAGLWPERIAMVREELFRRYRVRHGITPKVFASEQWQTLFKIEHPGVL
jgi:hypothetical protein